MNNKYFGKYLQYKASSASLKSGQLIEIGRLVRWEILRVGTGFVIRSSADNTKYLGVPDDPANNGITVVTVGESSIPQKCIWYISIAVGTGCLIRNAYNYKYLFADESSEDSHYLYTSDTTGTSGTDAYHKGVWRLISQYNMSGREMKNTSKFSPLVLNEGATGTPSLVTTPTDAIWASTEDFNYRLVTSSNVIIIDGSFKGISEGVTTVIATHKVTGIVLAIVVIVGSRPVFTISNYADQGYVVRYDGYSQIIEYNNIVKDKFEQLFGINITITYDTHNSSADICKRDTYGSVQTNNTSDPCAHNFYEHDTSASMRYYLQSGTSLNSKVLWTGHILKNNERSNSSSTTHTVIITPSGVVDDDDYTNLSDTTIRIRSIYALMHELSHQLGTYDHYCEKDYNSQGKCSNDKCDICVYGKTSVRKCLMGDWGNNVETQNVGQIYCDSCMQIITSHLKQHQEVSNHE